MVYSYHLPSDKCNYITSDLYAITYMLWLFCVWNTLRYICVSILICCWKFFITSLLSLNYYVQISHKSSRSKIYSHLRRQYWNSPEQTPIDFFFNFQLSYIKKVWNGRDNRWRPTVYFSLIWVPFEIKDVNLRIEMSRKSMVEL